MSWAFWRDKKTKVAARSADEDRSEGPRDDPADELRTRTRRRLIGAAALLLAAVIVLPMVLDPSPRPVPDSVVIDIPSDKTPFTPRLSQPSPAVLAPAARAPETPAKKAEAPEVKETARAAPDKPAPEPSKDATPPSTPAIKAGSAQFVLQAAALASETAARDLEARLKKAGFATYTERITTQSGDRIRVRVGPFATREDAEQARAKLKSLGIQAGVVSG
jgi:DedD protein